MLEFSAWRKFIYEVQLLPKTPVLSTPTLETSFEGRKVMVIGKGFKNKGILSHL